MRYQTLFKEYVWLVNTISRVGRITLEEINRRWLQTDMSEGEPITRSSFRRHREAIEEIFGICIECDVRDAYKYYIENAEVLEKDSIQNWMLSTMTVTNLLSEYKGLHDRVLLESVPSSEPFLSEIMRAMRLGERLRIYYQKYSSELGRERGVSPYCVKLYRRRWYMIGAVDSGEIRTFSLDRILRLEYSGEKFLLPDDFDAEYHFRNVVGVIADSDKPCQRVVVRAFGLESYYLRDLPLHSSQREINRTEGYVDYEYRLIPNSDFERLLMSRGAAERVLEPQWLADRMRELFSSASDNYSDNSSEEYSKNSSESFSE